MERANMKDGLRHSLKSQPVICVYLCPSVVKKQITKRTHFHFQTIIVHQQLAHTPAHSTEKRTHFSLSRRSLGAGGPRRP
jgi:hypothetical protein